MIFLVVLKEMKNISFFANLVSIRVNVEVESQNKLEFFITFSFYFFKNSNIVTREKSSKLQIAVQLNYNSYYKLVKNLTFIRKIYDNLFCTLIL